jgi:hypothetical protein
MVLAVPAGVIMRPGAVGCPGELGVHGSRVRGMVEG